MKIKAKIGMMLLKPRNVKDGQPTTCSQGKGLEQTETATCLKGIKPSDTLVFKLLAPRTMRKYISVAEGIQFVGLVSAALRIDNTACRCSL